MQQKSMKSKTYGFYFSQCAFSCAMCVVVEVQKKLITCVLFFFLLLLVF
jgi:hypothetical protein